MTKKIKMEFPGDCLQRLFWDDQQLHFDIEEALAFMEKMDLLNTERIELPATDVKEPE